MILLPILRSQKSFEKNAYNNNLTGMLPNLCLHLKRSNHFYVGIFYGMYYIKNWKWHLVTFVQIKDGFTIETMGGRTIFYLDLTLVLQFSFV